MTDKSDEFRAFERLARKLVAVPKKELDAKRAAYRRGQRAKRRRAG